ncbi:hypothetical protein [Xanthomonas nasturtii]|uniref:hypothetical protein n=1 Tax=Xanthomonas nasturtii TaxID=1843581 RepID=UPI002B23A9A1|nr:hypothetical protein [Xanthomonas nasturtii]
MLHPYVIRASVRVRLPLCLFWTVLLGRRSVSSTLQGATAAPLDGSQGSSTGREATLQRAKRGQPDRTLGATWPQPRD